MSVERWASKTAGTEGKIHDTGGVRSKYSSGGG